MDIEALYQIVAEQQGRGHTVCMTVSRDHKDRIHL